MTYKPITLTDRFNILHHFNDCQFIPVLLKQIQMRYLTKSDLICLKNQIKDFPQNSRRGNTVVIKNIGNSIALDLYRI